MARRSSPHRPPSAAPPTANPPRLRQPDRPAMRPVRLAPRQAQRAPPRCQPWYRNRNGGSRRFPTTPCRSAARRYVSQAMTRHAEVPPQQRSRRPADARRATSISRGSSYSTEGLSPRLLAPCQWNGHVQTYFAAQCSSASLPMANTPPALISMLLTVQVRPVLSVNSAS